MKRLWLIIFFFGMIVKTFSQPYFSKMYDLFGGWESANNLLYYNSSTKEVILSGTFINFNVTDSTKYRHAYIWTIDSIGNYKVKTLFADSPNNMIGFLPLKTKNNIILKAESQQSDSSFTFNKLYYINLNGDTLNSFLVEYPKRFNSTEYIIKGGLIYSFGTDVLIKPWPFAALCFDTTGKQLWYKVYTGKRVFPTGAALTLDGHFLVGGVESISDGGFKDSLFAWFAKIDTLGNIIWQKKIPNINNLSVSNISPIEIKGIYYWFGGYPSSQKDLSQLAYSYLIKINTTGDIIFNEIIIEGISARHDYMVSHLGYPLFKNNNIYMLGQASDTMSYVKYNDYIQFCKLDTLGNIKWRRTFAQWYMSNRPFSLTAVPDGFIICADGKDTTHTTGFTDAWIIKTDTNGCIIPGCQLNDGVTEIVDAKNYVKVYPNPANTQITIIFEDPMQTRIDFVEVLNSRGVSLQTVKVNSSECAINTNQLPNGLYYIAAYFNGDKRVVKKVLVEH